MERGGIKKLPSLDCDAENQSIFGIFDIYRRSTLHTGKNERESTSSLCLRTDTSSKDVKEIKVHATNSVAKETRSRDPVSAADILLYNMLKSWSSVGKPLQKYKPIKLIDSGIPYDFKIDIWSFGIAIIEMFAGEPPYVKESQIDAMKMIKKYGKLKTKLFSNLSGELQDFLNKCLEVDMNVRASAQELLEHRFLNCASEVVAAVNCRK